MKDFLITNRPLLTAILVHNYFPLPVFHGKNMSHESAFKTNTGVFLVNCMAHIRRKFEYALVQDKKNAEYALSKIALLYQLEKECDNKEISVPELLVR